MAREDEIAAILAADATLSGILTGGIYTAGGVGEEGVSRDTTPAAFDAAGYLSPCALVRQRSLVPTGQVRDENVQVISTAQIVEVWLYEDRLYVNIDSAKMRIYQLLEGYILEDAFPLQLTNIIDRQRDAGALSGSSLARLDFAVYSILEPVALEVEDE